MTSTAIESEIRLGEHTVLYVDDVAANRLVFEAEFGDTFRIALAGGGAEALQRLEQGDVRVLLTDHRMPGMTGIDLCEIVRERHPEVVRILVTAYSDQATAIESINRGGVSHYLAKPWKSEDVRRMLEQSIVRTALEHRIRSLRVALDRQEQRATVGALRARIMHDLVNPVMAIDSARLALERLLPRLEERDLLAESEELERQLRRIESSSALMKELLRRPRSWTASRQPVTSPVDARLLLQTARDLVRLHLVGTARLELPETGPVPIWAHWGDVLRILTNLVVNACEAIRAEGATTGTIHIELKHQGERAVFRISDSGPGIDPAIADAVFEPFVTTREPDTGRGLGLATCRELAESNGGRIALESTTQGAGTVFRLELPTEPPVPAEA